MRAFIQLFLCNNSSELLQETCLGRIDVESCRLTDLPLLTSTKRLRKRPEECGGVQTCSCTNCSLCRSVCTFWIKRKPRNLVENCVSKTFAVYCLCNNGETEEECFGGCETDCLNNINLE